MTKELKKSYWIKQCQILLNQYKANYIVSSQYQTVYSLLNSIGKAFSHYKKYKSSGLHTNLIIHTIDKVNPLTQLAYVIVSIREL